MISIKTEDNSGNRTEHIKTLSPKKDQTPFAIFSSVALSEQKKVRLKAKGS